MRQTQGRPWEGTTARFAAIGLATVLLLLTAFAGWTAVHTMRLTSLVSERTALVRAYQEARFATSDQESLVLRYESNPAPATWARVIAAGGRVVRALTYVNQHGDARDRKLASELLRKTRVYMSEAPDQGAFFLSSSRMTRSSSARPISPPQIKGSPFRHQLPFAFAVSLADTTRQEGAFGQAYALH